MQRFFFFHSHFAARRATRSCSCSPHTRAHERHEQSTRRSPFAASPLAADCHLATPLAISPRCCARYPGPVPMTEWRGMAWHGVPCLALAWRRSPPPPNTSALSSSLSLSLFLSPPQRESGTSRASSRAERSRTQRKRGESRHSRLRPTERNSHSVNAHALRQLTVSVNHGDERITGNTRAAAALNQQPLNQKEIK